MGEFLTRDKTGALFSFDIKGDKPSTTEMERISAYFNGKPATAVAAPEPEEEPGIIENTFANIMRGWNETQAGVDIAMQGYHEKQGNKEEAAEWEKAARDQLAERDTYKIREKAFTEEPGVYGKVAHLAGQVGRTGMAMAGSTVAAGLGAVGGAAIGGPVGAVLGAGAGAVVGAGFYAPQMLSANAERQIAKYGRIEDFDKAFAATGMQAGVEALTDNLVLRSAKVLAKGGKATLAALGVGKALPRDVVNKSVKEALTLTAKRIGGPAALGAVSGSIEEVFQTGLERWQADMALMDDDAKAEYLEAAIVGGTLEGLFGGAAGYVGHRQHLGQEKRIKEAKDDYDARVATLQQQAQTNFPAHQDRRAGKYEVPPTTASTEEQIAVAGALPDFSAETREQKILSDRELPPGLREFERGQPPPQPFEEEGGIPDWQKEFGRDPEVAFSKMQPSDPRYPEVEAWVKAKRAGQPPPPVQGPVQPLFSETEYLGAIDTLRDFSSISVDRITKETKLSRPKAQAVFDEMLRRNDAFPAGTQNQYAKITVPHGMATRERSNVSGKIPAQVSRDYIVKPVRAAQQKPFTIEINGKKKGTNRFTSRDEAQAWIDKNVPAGKKKDATVGEDTSGQQYGIYRQHYEHRPNNEERLIGEEVVNTFSTQQEADEAIKEYDPAYSPETNRRKVREIPVAEKQARIKNDERAELGPIADSLRNYVNRIIGPNRTDIEMVPRIDRDYMKRTFPDMPEDQLPPESAVVEGFVRKDPKKLLHNIMTLAADLNSPTLTEEQRTRLIEEVVNHELIHLARNLDLLTKKEWDILFRAALTQKVPGKSYSWAERSAVQNAKHGAPVVMEEAIAEMFRHYIKDPTSFRNPVRGLLQKIADFLKRLIGLGKRHKAEDLMDVIFEGGIADRKIGHGKLGPRNQDDISYSLLKTDNFYLKSARFIDGVQRETAPKNDWIKMLSNAGISQDELNWLGIKQWLQELPKDEDVHKNDIRNYIAASGPDVRLVIFAKQEHPDLANAAVMDPRWEHKTQTSVDKTYAEVAFTFPGRKGEPEYIDRNGHLMVPDRLGVKKLAECFGLRSLQRRDRGWQKNSIH